MAASPTCVVIAPGVWRDALSVTHGSITHLCGVCTRSVAGSRPPTPWKTTTSTSTAGVWCGITVRQRFSHSSPAHDLPMLLDLLRGERVEQCVFEYCMPLPHLWAVPCGVVVCQVPWGRTSPTAALFTICQCFSSNMG